MPDPTGRPVGTPGHRTDTPRVRSDARSRAQVAFHARVMGATWTAAAQAAGYKHDSTCAAAVRKYIGALPTLDREAERAVARERVSALWSRAWQAVIEGQPGSISNAVRVLERQARLLGLDAPQEQPVQSGSSVVAIGSFMARPRQQAAVPAGDSHLDTWTGWRNADIPVEAEATTND